MGTLELTIKVNILSIAATLANNGQYVANNKNKYYSIFMIPILLTPIETQRMLAERFKALRLTVGFKRSTMAKRSGVTESSLKRFENTGEISLKNLLRLSHAVDRLQEFDDLLQPLEATSLAELKAADSQKIPRRGRI